ncbi:hypothetical protein D3C72_1942800 [compost metagenome]
MQRALQRFIRLQTHDSFEILVDITRRMSGDGGGDVQIEIDRRMRGIFLSNTVHHFVPQRRRSRRRLRKEGFVAFVWGIVVLNKITHIDRVLPFISAKPGPRVAVRRRADIYINLHDFLSVSGVNSG